MTVRFFKVLLNALKTIYAAMGHDRQRCSSDGLDLFRAAGEAGDVGVLHWLINDNGNLTLDEKREGCIEAVRSADKAGSSSSILIYCLDNDIVEADNMDVAGVSPLTRALRKGQSDIVGALLNRFNVEVNGFDEAGKKLVKSGNRTEVI